MLEQEFHSPDPLESNPLVLESSTSLSFLSQGIIPFAAFNAYEKLRIHGATGFHCDDCGVEYDNINPPTIHHKVPLDAGGRDDLPYHGGTDEWNGVSLCRTCHVYHDNKVFLQGIVYGDHHITQAPRSLIGNKRKHIKWLKEQGYNVEKFRRDKRRGRR